MNIQRKKSGAIKLKNWIAEGKTLEEATQLLRTDNKDYPEEEVQEIIGYYQDETDFGDDEDLATGKNTELPTGSDNAPTGSAITGEDKVSGYDAEMSEILKSDATEADKIQKLKDLSAKYATKTDGKYEGADEGVVKTEPGNPNAPFTPAIVPVVAKPTVIAEGYERYKEVKYDYTDPANPSVAKVLRENVKLQQETVDTLNRQTSQINPIGYVKY